jgi:uracil-DNA glycosylase
VDLLLRDLARCRIGDTFNQYAGPDGGLVRRSNLRRYLAERDEADVVAVGEAAGFRGARWSGVAFTSEQHLTRWGAPYALTSDRPRGWSEPSGTIVHRTLAELGAQRRVVLWNIVPTHPHRPGAPLTNRRPTAAEVAAGLPYLDRLLEALSPALVVAVGRIAEAALGERAGAVIRHPAHGGAAAFAAGLRSALGAGGASGMPGAGASRRRYP